MLAEVVPAGERVLDVGCGDGYLLAMLAADPARRLAGVDVSEAELQAARARDELAGAMLVQGRAEALPFRAESYDVCVSHLAFTLMAAVETVVAEIARVLRPGGVFAAIVGGGPAAGVGPEAFDAFLARVGPMAARAGVPRLGDPRARDPRRIDEILGPAGFGEASYRRGVIDLGGSVDEVWATLRTLYELDGLDDAAVEAAYREVVEELAGAGGYLPCAMAVGLVTATRGECR